MNTAFRKSFARDLKKVADPNILARVRQAIESVETADDLQGIGNLKKMAGTAGFYRIRIGDYRIGIALEGNTVEFIPACRGVTCISFFPRTGIFGMSNCVPRSSLWCRLTFNWHFRGGARIVTMEQN